ncbi:MAG: 6-phosphogluconolactonase [Marinobacter sp.]|nr:6-phosphogluconolactonase [Marinobacter sp.]
MKTIESALPTGVSLQRFDSAFKLAEALAARVEGRLKVALTMGDRASLVVSGGSTPKLFLQTLGRRPLDWPRIDITLADERLAPTSSGLRNDAMISANLLQGAAAAARFVPLVASEAAEGFDRGECSQRLAAIHWPLDVVVLGMGLDGHCASLFPDAPELADAMDLSNPASCWVTRPLSQSAPRVTLTRSALSSAGLTLLHIQGENKLRALESIVVGAQQPPPPIAAFINAGLEIVWCP